MAVTLLTKKADPSHVGQHCGSERKARVKDEKQAALRAEADSRGISIAQLRQEKQSEIACLGGTRSSFSSRELPPPTAPSRGFSRWY